MSVGMGVRQECGNGKDVGECERGVSVAVDALQECESGNGSGTGVWEYEWEQDQ